MSNSDPTWGRKSVELPPGWHEALRRFSTVSKVKLKYLHAAIVDHALSELDLHELAETAWQIQKDSARDWAAIAAHHTPDKLEAAYKRSKALTATPKPRGKNSAKKPKTRGKKRTGKRK